MGVDEEMNSLHHGCRRTTAYGRRTVEKLLNLGGYVQISRFWGIFLKSKLKNGLSKFSPQWNNEQIEILSLKNGS